MATVLAGVLAFLKDAFTQNLALKALSLLFAIGFFAFQRGQEDEQQRTIPVGVVVRLPPESAKRELMTPPPPSVHVTLRGSTRAIDRLIQTGVAPVELDLRDGKKERITFESSNFSLPPDVELAIIDPPAIKLDWDDVITRKIPIQASITGKPAEGFVVQGEPEVEPKEVEVSGPRRQVETMQFARLAAFDVSGLNQGDKRQIRLDEPAPRLEYIGSPFAFVSVNVAKPVTKREFEKLPVEVVGVRGKTKPKFVEVTVLGPPEVVNALRAEQVVPRVDLAQEGVDLKERKSGSVFATVLVELAGAEATVQPPKVKVEW